MKINIYSGNVKSAWYSLRASRVRSFFTMLGVIIGITSVVTVVSLGTGLKHQLSGQINRLGPDVLSVRSGQINASNTSSLTTLSLLGISSITPADVTTLGKVPQLKAVAPFDFVTNTVTKNGTRLGNVFVIGTTPDLASVAKLDPRFGNFLSGDTDSQNVAVLGSSVALKLFNELNPVGESFNVDGQPFTVYGVLPQSPGGLLSVAQTDFNSSVFIPFSTAQRLNAGHADILQVLVKAADSKKVNQAALAAQSALARSHPGASFSVLTQKQLADIANGVINTATKFISAVAGISLLVGGIGIMDVMLVSVSERTREIGLRKAVGATNRQVLNQFMIEGLVLSVGGGIIGILASLLVDLLLKLYTNWQPVLDWPILVVAAIVSVDVGIVFSAVPAIKAAAKNPIEALRSE